MSDQVVSWRDVTMNCPAIASDGVEVGRVVDVAALAQEDIFHGIVVHHHALGKHFLIPAADVGQITEAAVHLSVDSAHCSGYQEFHAMHVEGLGLKGLFHWKHLGWKDSAE